MKAETLTTLQAASRAIHNDTEISFARRNAAEWLVQASINFLLRCDWWGRNISRARYWAKRSQSEPA